MSTKIKDAKRMLIACFSIIGLQLSMLYITQPVFANDSPLQLVLDEKTNEEKTAHIQLITQAKFDLIDLIIPDGTEINKEKTLIQNVGEIEYIKEIDGKIQIKFINDKETSQKLDLYINKDKSFEKGSLEAVTDGNVHSNKLILHSPKLEQTATFETRGDTWHEVTTTTAEIKKGGNSVKVTKGTGVNSTRFVIKNTTSTYPEFKLSADLIINDKLLQKDSLPLSASDGKVDMFNSKRKTGEKISINVVGNKMLMEFTVDKLYFVQVEIEVQDSGDILKSYTITNKSGSSKKIGLSELSNMTRSMDIESYKSFLSYTGDSITSVRYLGGVDPKTPYFQWHQGDFENWIFGKNVDNLAGYKPADTSGKGVEQPDIEASLKQGIWKQHGQYYPNYGIAGKINRNTVANNQTTQIVNKIRIKTSGYPKLTLKQTKFTIMHGETSIQLNGTVYDKDRGSYHLYYRDDLDDKTILIKSFNEQPGKTVPVTNLTADLGELSVGGHTGRFYLVDDDGLLNETSVSTRINVLTEEDEWNEIDTDTVEIQNGGNYVKVNKSTETTSSRPQIGKISSQFPATSLSGDLIIGDAMLQTDALSNDTTDIQFDMFNSKRKKHEALYVNKRKNRLLQAFTLDNKYFIEVAFEIQASGDIVKHYSITNKSGAAQKIGISELVHLARATSSDYYTMLIPYESNAITLKFKDWKTAGPFIQWYQGDFKNWMFGQNMQKFAGYKPVGVLGEGVEKLNAELDSKGTWLMRGLNYPNYQISGKTTGNSVENDETTKVANSIKIQTVSELPQLTLENTNFTLVSGQSKVKLDGTLYDKERSGHQLYYHDNTDNKTVRIKSFNKPAGATIAIEDLTADLGELSVGKHVGKFFVMNDYGLMNETKVPAEITVLPPMGKAIIQKVKVDDSFDKTMDELFSEITGEGIKMSQLKKPDTSKVGFTTATATLENTSGIKSDIEIPVNVYDEETTTFYDKEEIAVDGTKEASFTVGELDVNKDWKALIKEKIKLKSWDMKTGEVFTTELKEENLKSVPGSYKASFSINKKDQPLVHDVALQVTGYLKFEQVPDFDYGTAEIPKNRTILSRAGDDQIIINDERGANNNWRLTAVLTKETDRKFGNLLFVNADNQEQRLEVNERILIKEAQTEKTALQPLGWQEKTGLLFEISPGSYSGKYSGNIEWSLEDVPMK